MMSVYATFLLLAVCLSLTVNGAPNKKNEEEISQPEIFVRPRKYASQYTNDALYINSRCSSSTTSWAPAFATGSFPFPRWPVTGSGTGTGGSTLGSSGFLAYPTQGALYQNFTSYVASSCSQSPATTSSALVLPSIASVPPQGGNGSNSENGSGNQCLAQQTVTLPPQTITLPPETVTVNAAPQTITVTPQAQTTTITITPQIQTTTITVTITAGPAPGCQTSKYTVNSEAPAAAAPSQPPLNIPAPVASNIPAAIPVLPNAHSLSTTPVLPAASSYIINNVNTSPSIIPPTQTSLPASSSIITIQSTTSSVTVPIVPVTSVVFISLTAPYRNGTVPSNVTAPIGSGSSGFLPPTGSGFVGPTNGPTAPVKPPPRNVSSIGSPPIRSNSSIVSTTAPSLPPVTSLQAKNSSLSVPVPPPISSLPQPLQNSSIPQPQPISSVPPLPISSISQPPPPFISSTSLEINISTPLVSAPLAGSGTQPPLTIGFSVSSVTPVSQIISSVPPPSTTTTPASCINHTTTTNMSANYDDLYVGLPAPLLYLGLNYTSFTLSDLSTSPSPPNHLAAAAQTEPKIISILDPNLSFNLHSMSLSCGDNPPPAGTCTVRIYGVGRSAGGAASEAVRSVVLNGPGMQEVSFEEGGWSGLQEVSFTASVGTVEGAAAAVGLDDLVYGLVSTC